MHHRNLQDTPHHGKLTEADLDTAIAAKFLPLHPTIALALAPLRPLPPTVYRASLGRQRAFLSITDAMAYDRAYRAHPLGVHAEMGTPACMGWMDARDDADGAVGMDDMAEWAHAHGRECGRHL